MHTFLSVINNFRRQKNIGFYVLCPVLMETVSLWWIFHEKDSFCHWVNCHFPQKVNWLFFFFLKQQLCSKFSIYFPLWNINKCSWHIMQWGSLGSPLYLAPVSFWHIPFILCHQLLSDVRCFATPWTAVHQASLSFTVSRSLLRLMSIKSVMPSNRLILFHPLLLCPQIFPTSRSFPVVRLFASNSQSIGASASASVLPVNIQD